MTVIFFILNNNMSEAVEAPCRDLDMPSGFEKFLAGETLLIRNSTDILPTFKKVCSAEAVELANELRTLHHLELSPEGTSRRDLVLMEDKTGNFSMIVVCRDLYPPEERNPAYGRLSVIGGTGVYDTPKGRNPIEFALEHSKLLSVIMRRKTWMAGLELGGMKATIPGESDWESSRALRLATGFLFSPAGPFKDAITGTDVRQTPDTIADVAEGSAIGGGRQIAGMIEELDTPGSCRYSMEETYDALREKLGRQFIPDLERATVVIQGFGRVGRPAARLMLERGAKVIISDPLLTGEDHKLPESLQNSPGLSEYKEFMKNKLKELIDVYGRQNIQLVKAENIFDQKGQVFCPCSSEEGSLTPDALMKMAKNGVKVILSAANNPFGKEHVWQRAEFAAGLGIIVPPEILANCGSVTAASMEPLFRATQKADPTLTAEQFLKKIAIPHIKRNSREKLVLLIETAERYRVDLYRAGEIAFHEAFDLPLEEPDLTS